MTNIKCKSEDCTILFFILVFLMLFYDTRPLVLLRGGTLSDNIDLYRGDDTILFFILVFLMLFYK
ncbi:MAG TPA: hypothetical protein GXX20_03655 [Clostridiaceae bacterium]|nr:hypothetical protein [Clostridiaceae bacterium]